MALTDDLISWWDLEEASGARDDAHGSNDLTDVNTVTSATGKQGDAAEFVRANSEELTKSSPSGTMTGDVPLTVAAWFRTVEDITAQGIVSLLGGSHGNWHLSLSADMELYFRIYTSAGYGTSAQVLWGSTIAINTWYFVMATHDPTANEISISVNNGTAVTQSVSGGAYGTVQDLAIGSHGISAAYFGGRIDSVGIWSAVKDTTERGQLYNGGSGLDYADLGSPPSSVTPSMTLLGVGAAAVIAPALWRKQRMDGMQRGRR